MKATSIDSNEYAKLCIEIILIFVHFQKTKKLLKYLITEPFYAHQAGILLQKTNTEFVTIAKRKKNVITFSKLSLAIERCSAK